MTDFDELSRSLSMWRQFTQWLGGMGIIVLAIAVLPRLRVGGRQLMESELPGPEVAQLPERVRQTARLLWVLYVGLTVVLAVSLAALGWTGIDERMTEFEALAHAFSTMPTGGFLDATGLHPGVLRRRAVDHRPLHAHRGRELHAPLQRFVRRRPRVFVRDDEFRLYLTIVLVASIALIVQIWGYDIAQGEEAIRAGVFQAISIITTTGYATEDFALWPLVSC